MALRTGHYELIAREGLPFIIPLFLAALFLWSLDYSQLSLVFLLVSFAVACFFRNPERTPPEIEGVVLSPADGVVKEIVRPTQSENLEGDGLQRISIFMSIFNVHVNRCPISGAVQKVSHVPGAFLDARDNRASQSNERNSIVVVGDDRTIEVVQVAGMIARRIACWVGPGDKVKQGDRFGLIRFGSRLDVYVPGNLSVSVETGDKVRAGVTVIAQNQKA